MIISHQYKFIFIKTNKTAGTSVEIALSKFCGEDDVITPVSPEDENLRRALGYRGPQNYLRQVPASEFKNSARRPKGCFYHRIAAEQIKEYIGETIWNAYYKFCFERNPWDRVVSLYYWRFKTAPRPAISEFIDSGAPLILKERGFDLYTIGGEIVVDRVCRFENLRDELERLREHFRFPESPALPNAKSASRQDKRHYREILSPDDRKKIEKMFQRKIQLFGYTF